MHWPVDLVEAGASGVASVAGAVDDIVEEGCLCGGGGKRGRRWLDRVESWFRG